MRIALIGSRKAPSHILSFGRALGKAFSDEGHVGYSGGAPGMDDAWMADYDRSRSRIIIPWEGFNEHTTSQGYFCWNKQSNQAKIKSIIHAESVTHYWDETGKYVQNLFSRNSMQILGLNCEQPVDAVYYWAPEIKRSVSGGTRVAVDIARKFNIPTYNLYFNEVREALEKKYMISNDLDWLLD